MDINNLEKLACLKLDENTKGDISKSLDEVVHSLQGIIVVDVEPYVSETPEQTVFRDKEYQKPETTNGLNITEEGYFLAPKVIKKD